MLLYTRPKGQETLKRGYIMESIEVTYKFERYDCFNFHGWVVWECSEGMESVYYQDESFDNAMSVYRDLVGE